METTNTVIIATPATTSLSRNKGGRPRKTDKCTEQLAVMCTLFDRKRIEARAKAAGGSVSEFLRNLALGSKIVRPKTLPKEVLHFKANLSQIGSNLNQLSKKNNTPYGMNNEERQEALSLIEKLRGIMDDIKSWLR